jgi:hypothetical protein
LLVRLGEERLGRVSTERGSIEAETHGLFFGLETRRFGFCIFLPISLHATLGLW